MANNGSLPSIQSIMDFLTMMDKFTERENPERYTEGMLKLYGISLFFFVAWLYLSWIFYIAIPGIILDSIYYGLLLTWWIGVYPLVRLVTYIIEKIKAK